MADLRALADRFVSLSSEIESVRREMLVCLSNGLNPDEASAPGRPAAAKPNGVDPHPPPHDQTSPHGGERFAPPRQAKVSRPASAFAAKTAEQRLIQAMRDNPGASVNVLAKAAGANRSSTGERLRQLAGRGAVEKDPAGRWRIAEEKPPAGGESRPMQASP